MIPIKTKENLTLSLRSLSTGWIQEHVDRANSILSNKEYTSNDWQVFFEEYFTEYPFTDHLRNYLGYPVFMWFDDSVNLSLQKGLILPLQKTIQGIVTLNDTDLGQAMDKDPNLNQTLFNSHRFFNIMANAGSIDDAYKKNVYDFYAYHITSYPYLWKSTSTIDKSSQPYVASIRALIYMNLGDALPLIPERIIEISDLIDLEGMYSKIWKDFTVLVIANNGLDEKQLDVIHCFLRKLPTEIHDLRYITVDKMLEDIEKHPVSLEVNTPAVNIFDNRVGLISENGFPDDVPPFYSDLFSLALAHEVNHRVHSTFSRTSQSLKNRRNELIKAAGSNQMNYLRSTLAAGFFITNSQEFFASISNQWFANTERTLELALIRWNNGYKDPINQFLFFAEVYSKGGNTVPFYIMDVQGNLSCIEITVNRNVHGHIDTLCVGENTYKFSLNISGDVLGIYH